MAGGVGVPDQLDIVKKVRGSGWQKMSNKCMVKN